LALQALPCRATCTYSHVAQIVHTARHMLRLAVIWAVLATYFVSVSAAPTSATPPKSGARTLASLGIRINSSQMATVVPQYTTLPASISKTFTSGGALEILAGGHPLVNAGFILGHLDLRPSIPKGAVVLLTFEVEQTGLLTVTAEDVGTSQIARGFFQNYKYMQMALACRERGGSWHAFASLEEQMNAVKRAMLDQSTASDDSEAEDFHPANCSQWSWDQHFGQPNPRIASIFADEFEPPSLPEPDWRQEAEHFFATELCKRALLGTMAIALSLAWLLLSQGHSSMLKTQSEVAPALAEEQRKVANLSRELEAAKASHAALGAELAALRSQQRPRGEEFAMMTYDEVGEQGTARHVKIQCPGVTYADIEMHIIFNGAIVHIHRKQSQWMASATWKQKLQFPLDDGHYEFKEEEAQLEFGILSLVFRACPSQPRVFRFPQNVEISRRSPGSSSWTAAPDRNLSQHFAWPSSWNQHEVDAQEDTVIAMRALPQGGRGELVLPIAQPDIVLSGLPTESSRSLACVGGSSQGSGGE